MKTFLISLLLFLAGTAEAQDVLTMDRAIATALERNRSLSAARLDLQSARWGTRNSYSRFLPKVELSASYTRIDPETDRMANATLQLIREFAGMFGIPASALADIKPFAYRNTFASGVNVIQPIYNGGAEFTGVKAASAAEDRSQFTLQDTEQDVVARVQLAYFDVLKAQAMLVVAKDAAGRTKRYLEMTRHRAELGSRTQTDVLRWEVQLASDEGGIINAENFLAVARLRLNEVMGVPLDDRYTLMAVPGLDSLMTETTDTVESATVASQRSPAEAMDTTFLDMHPALRIMDANLRLADANVDMAWVNFKPRINAAFQYGWEKNNTAALDGIKPWALALSVSLPIFNGFGDYSNLQRARAEYDRTEVQAESVRRGLLMQATNAELALVAARKRIEIARKAEQQARDVLSSVQRRYESGGASNIDLIDAQTAYSAAKTNQITALYDHSAARVQLARATGTVTP